MQSCMYELCMQMKIHYVLVWIRKFWILFVTDQLKHYCYEHLPPHPYLWGVQQSRSKNKIHETKEFFVSPYPYD